MAVYYERQVPVILQSYIPQRLSPYLDRMIYFKDFTPTSQVERLVPTVSLFLVIELDGLMRQIFHNEKLDETLAVLQEVDGGWISGFQKQYRSISAHSGSEMLIVQFKPLGASYFLPLPLTDYENRILSAGTVLGPTFDALRTRLMLSASPEAKFQIIEDWLESRKTGESAIAGDLEKVLVEIQRNHFSSISSLVQSYPRSHRQFIVDFKKFVGTTPKFFQRVVRFESILASIEQKETINWAELSYRWGFSDQSHLVREFVHFSGFVPTEFVEREFQKEGTNFFPLVKKRQDGTAMLE